MSADIRSKIEKKIEIQEREIESLRTELLRKEGFLDGLIEAFETLASSDDAPKEESTAVKARGDGRLLLRNKIWWICWYENGEERRESTGAVNEEEAQKLLAEVVDGVKDRKDQKIAERIGLVASAASPSLPEPPALRNHETTTEPTAPKRRGRPPMITRAEVDKAMGTESIDSDPKCNRSSCVHTKSQHTGSNGKCVGCWCYGFVGSEQFAKATG